MATTVNVTSNYNGALAGEIFIQAFKKADTISKRMITYIPNVLGSGFLPKLNYSADLVAATCGWNPTGQIDYTEKEVIVKKYQIQHEICKFDFDQTFQAAAQGLYAADSEIPATIQAAILDAIVQNLAEVVDKQIWFGNGSSNQFAGLIPQFTADTAVIDVVWTGATTKANVVSRIEDVYNAVPEVLDINGTGSDEVVLAVSKSVGRLYKQAQASMGLNTTVGDKELDYLGNRIETIGGLGAGTQMLAYRVKNLGFLTGKDNEWNNVSIADDETRLDGIVRTRVMFTAGVGYSEGAEIVYGRIA